MHGYANVDTPTRPPGIPNTLVLLVLHTTS